MDLTYTAEQQLLSQTAYDFARRALSPQQIRQLEIDSVGFDRDVWKKMVALGWAGALLSSESGTGVLEAALIVAACSRAALPSPYFSTIVEAGWLLHNIASEAHRTKWLSRIMTGDAIMTTAILERGGEYQAAQIETLMETASGGYRVSGNKLFVRDAKAADAVICLTRSGTEADHLTWVLVPTTADGVAIRRMPASGGEPLFEIILSSVQVERTAVVGEVGRAWPLAREIMLRGACLKGAELVGIGQAALELTLDYAKQRKQFGRLIGSFQAVHHHCADMYRDWHACRLLVYQAAALIDTGRPYGREVSLAKAKASEAIPALTRSAHQIHGSIAYYRDYPLELFYHRALAAQVAYGDAVFHRRQLAEILREEPFRIRGANGHDLPVHSL